MNRDVDANEGCTTAMATPPPEPGIPAPLATAALRSNAARLTAARLRAWLASMTTPQLQRHANAAARWRVEAASGQERNAAGQLLQLLLREWDQRYTSDRAAGQPPDRRAVGG